MTPMAGLMNATEAHSRGGENEVAGLSTQRLPQWQKSYVIHHLRDWNDMPAQERWFWRYHAPEVMRAPEVTRYVNFRAVPAPAGAEAYGYYNYHVHEATVLSVPSSGGTSGAGSLSKTPEPAPMDVAVCVVPAAPTEDFLGSDLTMDEKTIFRWLIVFKYPDGVSAEEGERWFLDVHAKEVMRQPGLTRFFSYKAVAAGLPESAPGQKSFMRQATRLRQGWHRLSEQWYENANGWRKSVIESPPQYTKPPWAKYEKYPFLEPFTDFVSTFILERPSEDYTRDLRPIYI